MNKLIPFIFVLLFFSCKKEKITEEMPQVVEVIPKIETTIFNHENSPIPQYAEIRDIHFDHNGKAWMLSSKRGLYTFFQEEWEVFNGTNSPLQTIHEGHSHPFDYSVAGTPTSSGDYYILVDSHPNHILYKYDGNAWESFPIDSIGNDYRSRMVEDDYQNLWITTGSGLLKFNGNNFKLFDKNNSPLRYFESGSTQIYYQRALAKMPDGKMLVANQSTRLFTIDPLTEIWEEIPTPDFEIPSYDYDYITSLLVQDDKIIFGTRYGIFVLENGVWEKLGIEFLEDRFDKVMDIEIHPVSNNYITGSDIIHIFDTENKTWRKFDEENTNLDYRCYANPIAISPNNEIWTGCTQGLIIFPDSIQ